MGELHFLKLHAEHEEQLQKESELLKKDLQKQLTRKDTELQKEKKLHAEHKEQLQKEKKLNVDLQKWFVKNEKCNMELEEQLQKRKTLNKNLQEQLGECEPNPKRMRRSHEAKMLPSNIVQLPPTPWSSTTSNGVDRTLCGFISDMLMFP